MSIYKNSDINIGRFAFDAVFFVLMFSAFTNILFTAYGGFKYFSNAHSVICIFLFGMFLFSRTRYDKALVANTLWTLVVASSVSTLILLVMLLLLPVEKNTGSYGAGIIILCIIVSFVCVGIEYNKNKITSNKKNQLKFIITFLLPIMIISPALGFGTYKATEMLKDLPGNAVLFVATFDDANVADPYWVEQYGDGWTGVPSSFEWQVASFEDERVNNYNESFHYKKSRSWHIYNNENENELIHYDLTKNKVWVYLDGTAEAMSLFNMINKGEADKYHAWSSWRVLDGLTDEERQNHYTSFSYDNTTPSVDKRNTIGANSFPRTWELGKTWKDEGLSDGEIIINALNYLSDNFTYHYDYLEHFPLVDDFVFEGDKRGVCSHFATIFTIMMRSADIPARVITGYRGGDFNDETNSYTVRAKDAHAWVEIWRGSERGWVRIDPTDVVPVEKGVPKSNGLLRFMENMGNFNVRQRNLGAGGRGQIKNSNEASKTLIKWPFYVIAGIFAIIVLLFGIRKSKNKINPIDKEWGKIVNTLSKKNIIKPWMGPGTIYLCSVKNIENHDEWKDLCTRYEKWKYDNEEDKNLSFELKKMYKKIKKNKNI